MKISKITTEQCVKLIEEKAPIDFADITTTFKPTKWKRIFDVTYNDMYFFNPSVSKEIIYYDFQQYIDAGIKNLSVSIQISPISYYKKNGYWYDQHINAETILPRSYNNKKASCEAECLFTVDGYSLNDIRDKMITMGFVYTPTTFSSDDEDYED